MRISDWSSDVCSSDLFVRKGHPLCEVDPRPYRAALAEAQADAASVRSALALAESDYDRVAGLTGDEAVAASEVDQLRTRVRSAHAALAAAQAGNALRAPLFYLPPVPRPTRAPLWNRGCVLGL